MKAVNAHHAVSWKELFRKYNLLLFIGFFACIAATISPKFFTFQNFSNLLQQSSVTGIVSVGMTLVILVGGIDLGVGSVLALSGMIVSVLLASGYGLVVSIGASLLAGALMGCFNGLVSAKGGVPSFITTLATMVAARGLALLTTDGKPVFNLPESFQWLGSGFVGPLPASGLLWILITVISALVLKYTTFGRGLYAVGGNDEAARLSGIRVTRSTVYVFMLSGVLSALGGIVLASWLTVGQPTAGKGMELDAIAAVVLGGASLSGGSGGVIGAFGGVWLLAIITNIFNLAGLSSYYQMILQGGIIVAALMLNQFFRSRD
ncbi:ABC transporter permease [Desulfovibrio inopinatus]|uniref:ABC transporter permease n=1 Tax=Desulfovibrio inopinatus TaxID=102109 RepID=UPI0004150ECA|nr:ABC transporter permease [Desulfovibrio inopinatus]